MLGKISGADVLLASVLSKITQARFNKSAQPLDDQKPTSEAVQRSRQALNSLRQANASQAQQRKANAKAKVERLKKELENLRLMGGDPKAIARRAAQISRELAAAAKEYAASKGQAGLGLPAETEAGGEAATTATGAENNPDAVQGAGAAGATAEAQTEAAKAEAAARDAQTAPFREDAAKIQQAGAERDEDTKFAAEVRRLHALAKSIFAEQRRRAEQEDNNDAEMDRLKKQIDAAGADIQQTFTDAGMATVAVPLVLQV